MRVEPQTEWAKEFFAEWDEHIYRLSPMIKDGGFADEKEVRIVHELYINELNYVKIRQKRSLLGRYIALNFAPQSWVGTPGPKLPLVGIVVGPSRHPAVSRVSVGTLLNQLGYQSVPVEISSSPLQSP